MKKQLVALLRSIQNPTIQKSYPVFQQGDLNDHEPYPPAFWTYWNSDTESESFYDNVNHRTVWSFTVYFYSADKELTNTILLEAKTLLQENGWIVDGKGYDVPSDEKDYTGRAIDIVYIEREEQNNAENL